MDISRPARQLARKLRISELTQDRAFRLEASRPSPSASLSGLHELTYDVVLPVNLGQLPSDLLCPIRRGVVNDNDLPSKSTRLSAKGYKGSTADLVSNVLARSHTMTGRFFRSLYVGRITEYLSGPLPSAHTARRQAADLQRILAAFQ